MFAHPFSVDWMICVIACHYVCPHTVYVLDMTSIERFAGDAELVHRQLWRNDDNNSGRGVVGGEIGKYYKWAS